MRSSYSEKLLEPIMFKYLELCVDLKKSHLAKEGLYQYRNIFQSVSARRGYMSFDTNCGNITLLFDFNFGAFAPDKLH